MQVGARATDSGDLRSDLARGALAGLIATAPMSVTMEALHRQLPARERYPLPPAEITAELVDAAGLGSALSREQEVELTLANHFAYGALVGALYPPLTARLPLSPVLSGMAHGLAVWTASYLGLLPVLGLLRPATEHPPRRSALMIAAHLVWGGALGLGSSWLAGSHAPQQEEPAALRRPGGS